MLPSLTHEVEVEFEGLPTRLLRMPYHAQTRKEGYCFVFSVKMCLGYFRDFFPDELVRPRVRDLQIDEIIKVTNTRVDVGTPVSNVTCARLTEEVEGVEFELLQGAGLDKLMSRLDDSLPTIVLYNGGYYEQEVPGPGHAGVLIGRLNQDPIFNNPWFGRHKRMDRIRLERSWELEYERAVLMNPNPQRNLDEFE